MDILNTTASAPAPVDTPAVREAIALGQYLLNAEFRAFLASCETQWEDREAA